MISFRNLIIWRILVLKVSDFNSICRNSAKLCLMLCFFHSDIEKPFTQRKKGVLNFRIRSNRVDQDSTNVHLWENFPKNYKYHSENLDIPQKVLTSTSIGKNGRASSANLFFRSRRKPIRKASMEIQIPPKTVDVSQRNACE